MAEQTKSIGTSTPVTMAVAIVIGSSLVTGAFFSGRLSQQVIEQQTVNAQQDKKIGDHDSKLDNQGIINANLEKLIALAEKRLDWLERKQGVNP